MLFFKVRTEDGTLTYTFHDNAYGRYGDIGLGVHIFVKAMKDYFTKVSRPATMTIMNENGMYYNSSQNLYVVPQDSKDIIIVLYE